MAMPKGEAIPQGAIDYLISKGLKPSEHWTDVWKEEHATSFTVARSAGYDILGDMHSGIEKMLREGQTLRQFEKDMTPLLQDKGWWGVRDDGVGLGSPRRLKIIYDANIRTARAAGQWQRIQERAALLPYLLYRLGPSVRHRAEHARWNGFIARVDDPFWDSHFTPNGWGCKCYIRQIDRRAADKLIKTGGYTDYRTSSPPIEYREWINRKTGEVHNVPVGIDPGWDTNPGKVRHGAALKVMTEKAKAMGDRVDITSDAPLAKLLRWVSTVLSW